VVTNALQGRETTNGSSANSSTNDTRAEDSQLQDPANTDDSNSGLGEDSDHIDTEDDVLVDEPDATPTNVKPRARKASGTHSSVPVTPTKRRKVSDDVVEQLTSSAVKDIPDSLIQPQKLSELVVGMLDKSHKGATTALANLFFAIGSPHAVECLRDACRQAHHFREIDTIPEEAGARRSTCALDRIHAHDKVSPILRRYHLVQLQGDHQTNKQDFGECLSDYLILGALFVCLRNGIDLFVCLRRLPRHPSVLAFKEKRVACARMILSWVKYSVVKQQPVLTSNT
jgi:hypothetical protein